MEAELTLEAIQINWNIDIAHWHWREILYYFTYTQDGQTGRTFWNLAQILFNVIIYKC